MIKNERQYRITRAQVARFENAVREFAVDKSGTGSQLSVLEQAQVDALQSQLADLKTEVIEYAALKSGKVKVFQADNFDDLPSAKKSADQKKEIRWINPA